MSEVAKFDASSLAEKVKDRIQGQVAEVLGDEFIDNLIASTIKEMLEPQRVEIDRYTNKWEDRPSKLQQMITNELTKTWQQKIDEAFKGNNAIIDWQGKITDTVQKLIETVANDPQIAQNVMGSIVTSMLQQQIMSIRNALMSQGMTPRF